jgi:N-acetylmuramoyl-L-alanine amidase
VVIDAGHGGHDSGAVGKNSLEKDLVLKMAMKAGGTYRENDFQMRRYSRQGHQMFSYRCSEGYNTPMS